MMKLPKREFLMRASLYNPMKHTVGGWYISELLEGIRVFWDGGISRETLTIEVPWANVVDPATKQIRKKFDPRATGLWTAVGIPVKAPDSFLNLLPCMPLEGMLWAGYHNLKTCLDACFDEDHEAWSEIEFAIFSSPPIDKIFSDGEIRNSKIHLRFNEAAFTRWLHRNRLISIDDWQFLTTEKQEVTFDTELAVLRCAIPSEGQVYLIYQAQLPYNVKAAHNALMDGLHNVLERGGLGVVVRDPDSCWEPQVVNHVLKLEK